MRDGALSELRRREVSRLLRADADRKGNPAKRRASDIAFLAELRTLVEQGADDRLWAMALRYEAGPMWRRVAIHRSIAKVAQADGGK